jgi:hypothetical protein
MGLKMSIVPIIALGLTACDENALRMAADAKDILSAYEKELEHKLASEQAAYTRQGQIEAEAAREQTFSQLEQERIERARVLALDFIDGVRDVSRWRDPIREYAGVDYRIQRQILLAGMDNDTHYLERIQALTIDKQKIAALSQAFGALAQKPDIVAQAKGLADFAKETKSDFDKAVCDGLAAQVKEKESEVKAAKGDAEKKKAQAALDALKDTQHTKNCSPGN